MTVEAQRQQLARGELVIGPPKSEAGRRTVAVPPQAVSALKAHLDSWTATGADAWVFTGDKGGPLRDAVWHEWDVARRSVGLPGLHFHDLRHVAATLTEVSDVAREAIFDMVRDRCAIREKDSWPFAAVS